MRILFLYPSYEKLGIEYLAAVLKSHGHTVDAIFDPQLFDENDMVKISLLAKIHSYKKIILREIENFKPDLMGFSVVTDEYQWACSMASEIKKRIKVPIIFGGVHPTLVPEHVINNDFVDMVCVGEGEEAMVELADSLERGERNYAIKNLWFKKENGGIIRNEMRPLVQDLDVIPFPEKDLFYKKNPTLRCGYFISASRGCLCHCSYCIYNFLATLYRGQKVARRRSVRNVIEELRRAKEKYRIKYVFFWDDSFTSDITWLSEFAPLYKKEIAIPFTCQTHPHFMKDDIAALLKDAGCIETIIGIQSLNPQIRTKILLRDTADEHIRGAVRSLKKNKIYSMVDFMLGLPTQSEQDLIDMLHFFLEEKPCFSTYCWLRYYPKMEINSLAVTSGNRSLEEIKLAEEMPHIEGLLAAKDTSSGSFSKLQLLQTLAYILPSFIVRYFLEKKRYKKLPLISTRIQFFLLALIGRRFFTVFAKRYLLKYFYFMFARKFV